MMKSLSKRGLWMATTAATCGLLVAASQTLRADDPKAPTTAPAGAAMSQADMDAMTKAATPGPEHAKMKEEAGDWSATVKFMMPDGSWSKPTVGTMHMDLMMDRYITMKYKGTIDMGGGSMPYEGFGMHGYDNVTKKYWSTWVDSMSTGILKTEGTSEGDKITLTGMMADPTTGKDTKVKEVVAHPDAMHSTYEMYCTMPNGQEMKMMEIIYAKK